MAEQIGKVILDDTFYPGQDLYCDGEIEDTLLSIVKKYPESEYPRIIEESRSWPVLYHLSHFRENIVNWLPIDRSMKVLEVGAGCGAITGALAAKAGSVTCVDLSKKRSMINAYRHKDCDNITIRLGNFKDIEPTLDEDYDYVFLIGVFEYGQGYMGSATPYQDFMKILKKHCSEHGRIVIAIENRYGLKYFAGCREDHDGSYFSGIEDYPEGGGARTFSRNKLIEIMESCGVDNYHFYYPYPDYKFMTAIYSDEYQPRVGELINNMRNFDRERMLLFDEKNAYDGLIRDGMFRDFSNSFLVVIGDAPEQIYAKFSNDRKPEYAIYTTICQDMHKDRYVEKIPDRNEAKEHVDRIAASCKGLGEKYAGCGMHINNCERTGHGVRLEFLRGKTLEEKLDECIYQDDEPGFCRLLQKFSMIASYHDKTQISDHDFIFANIIVDDKSGEWTLIDYEWTFDKALSGSELVKRAMFVYCIGPRIRRKWLFDHEIAQKCGVTPENLDALQQEELLFQHTVTGKRASMHELYDSMGKKAIPVAELLEEKRRKDTARCFQIYEDKGNGFSEKDSCFIENVYDANGHLKLIWTFGEEGKKLRLDPAMQPCLLHHMQITINGEQVKAVSNGSCIDEETVLFLTEDPNLTLDMEKVRLQDQNILEMTAEAEWLTEQAAACLAKLDQKKTKHTLFKR